MKLDVQQTIDALGGQSEVSRLIGMSRTAVRNWYLKNAVPHWQQARFEAMAKKLKEKKNGR